MDALIEALQASDTFAFDTETSSLDVMTTQLVGISFSVAAESGLGPATCADWSEQELLERLQPVFADADKEAIAHHFKFDYKVLAIRGLAFHNKVFDTMVAHYLIQPEASHKLDRLAETELGYATIPITDLIGKAGKAQKSMADLPVESITEYACEDADITFQLRQVFGPRLTEVAADELFQTVEMPLVKILADMELEGVRIDSDELNRYSQELGKQIDGLTAEIHDHAGQEFNIDSPKQLGPILFETLEIKARVKENEDWPVPHRRRSPEKIKGSTPLCRPSCATANSRSSSPPMSIRCPSWSTARPVGCTPPTNKRWPPRDD